MRLYFGYRIKDGSISIHPVEGAQVKKIYKTYIEGLSLAKTAEAVGLNKSHSQIGRILSNEVYLGTDVYPKLVSKSLFDAAQKKRDERRQLLGRNFKAKEEEMIIPRSFGWKKREKVTAQPFKRAKHIYQTIEVIK